MRVYFDPLKSNNVTLTNEDTTVTTGVGSNAKVNTYAKTNNWIVEFVVESKKGATLGIGDSRKREKFPGSDSYSVGINVHDGRYWFNNQYQDTQFKVDDGDIVGMGYIQEKNIIQYFVNEQLSVEKNITFQSDKMYIEVGTGGASRSIITLISHFKDFYYEYPINYEPYNNKDLKVKVITMKV